MEKVEKITYDMLLDARLDKLGWREQIMFYVNDEFDGYVELYYEFKTKTRKVTAIEYEVENVDRNILVKKITDDEKNGLINGSMKIIKKFELLNDMQMTKDNVRIIKIDLVRNKHYVDLIVNNLSLTFMYEGQELKDIFYFSEDIGWDGISLSVKGVFPFQEKLVEFVNKNTRMKRLFKK